MRAKEKRVRFARQYSRLVAAPVKRPKQNKIFKRPTARMTVVMAAGVLCILAVTAYANAIRNGFVWDDHEQVVMNASRREGVPFRDLVTPNNWGPTRGGVRERSNYYRPLQMMAYRLTAEVFGFNATAFHAVNLAFHVIVVLLAFTLFYTLTDRMGLAFASAALFAVHPIHSEAVDWISALPDIGCTAFFLLAFLFHVLASGQKASQQPIILSRRTHVLFYAASFADGVAVS